MKNNNQLLQEFWETVCLCEDFFTSGYRHDRVVPDFTVSEKAVPGASLEMIHAQVRECRLCGLCDNRLQAVPGEGVSSPLVMVIGEAPGADEDKTGSPFVGKAGLYLDKWLHAIDCSRQTNCYIANIVKCRPPQNRDPYPDEIDTCFPYLEKQIQLLRPGVILTVGRLSSQKLTGQQRSMRELRGGVYFFKDIPVVPTCHPDAVLQDPSLRAKVWEDLKRLKDILSHVNVL
ncbi:MAG: uracil-DNA glycosylase [Spirochaetales bacterium]|nr:uracil-DNA glycosylase [Spirochaetales bacterium]